jgi:phosphoribosylanthranilate isomerase
MTIVKICGITNIEDARAAVEAGADLLGFIFYPPSPRYVTPEGARQIVNVIRETSNVRLVGVFVNESLDQVRGVMETAGLELAQLHGKEAPEMVREMGARAYKSLQATDLDTAHVLMANYRAALGDVRARGNVPAFIADAPPAKLPGGNGMVADWSVAREIASEFPILLAGGLNPENVQEAIERVQPWGVDVSSGVERAPGLKDHGKVREFLGRVKG